MISAAVAPVKIQPAFNKMNLFHSSKLTLASFGDKRNQEQSTEFELSQKRSWIGAIQDNLSNAKNSLLFTLGLDVVLNEWFGSNVPNAVHVGVFVAALVGTPILWALKKYPHLKQRNNEK